MKSIEIKAGSFTVLLTLLLGISSCHPEKESGVDFLKGPWLQNQKQHAITIMWETISPEKGFVEYGTKKKLGERSAETEPVKLHKRVLTGLEPGMIYHYRVVSGGRKGRIFTFHTQKEKGSAFTMAVYGDNKNGPFNHKKIADWILTKDPDLVINNGDMVERGEIYGQWEKLFFIPIRELAARVPVYTVMGNHEDNARYYYDFFDPPTDTIPWYSFDYGNAHIVVLNTEEKYLMNSDRQIEWLKKDLAQHKDATWKIVNLHIPPFTCGGNYYARDRLKVKQLLVPIFLEYGVDLVMSGHDHDYERTWPIGSKRSNNPVTFIICGNGGTPLRQIYPREFTKFAERVYGFTLLHFNGEKLQFQAFNIYDSIIDSFSLDKSDPASMEAYRKGMLNYDDIKDASREIAGYYREGHHAAKKRLWDQAVVYFQKAIDLDSTCYQAMGEMAKCYVYLGQYDKALKYGSKAQKNMPTLPYAYEAIIRSYRKQGKYQEALHWCREMFRYTSDSPDAYTEMADVYREMGDTANVIGSLRKAADVLPNDYEVQFKLAGLYAAKGDTGNAVACYKKGIYWDLEAVKGEEYKKAQLFVEEHR